MPLSYFIFFYFRRRDKFTPNYNSRVCGWHFPDGKAAGPTRFAWNAGKAFSDHIPTKRKKGMVPASVEDEGAAEPGPNHLDIATQTPGTSSVVLFEVENDMLRKENDQLKRELEKQKQTFSFSQISSHPDKVNYYTGLPDVATVLFLKAFSFQIWSPVSLWLECPNYAPYRSATPDFDEAPTKLWHPRPCNKV